MKIDTDLERIASPFGKRVVTIDSHTAGEMTRLVVDGINDVRGATMAEKLEYFKSNLDHIRLRLTREPRGHRGVLAAAVTESPSEDAVFGLIYMDAKRYPYLCGHATIGAVATLAAAGLLDLSEGENLIPVDTPSGIMNTVAFVEKGRVRDVAIRMVPSFVLDTGKVIDVEGFGALSVDLVCAGGFFAMVSSDQVGKALVPENASYMADLGMKIIDAANEQLEVFHPERPEVTTVDVAEFYDVEPEGSMEGRGLVVYGESKVDRSPCGTGTAAKLTLLHHKGLMKVNSNYRNYSPLNTVFDSRIVECVKIREFDAVVAEIKGMAHVTGVHAFVVQDGDPFPEGFLI
ncbi:MAG: proline racemase family protein [Thermodesulfobacteriota bacterium]